MTIEFAALSVIVGLIRRGNLRNLGQISLRHFYVFVVPLLLLGVVATIAEATSNRELLPLVKVLNIAQFAILLAAVAMNLHIHGMFGIGIGVFSNLLVVAANGGVMPASVSAIRLAGRSDLLRPEVVSRFVRHSLIGPETRLSLLSDVIPIPGFGILGREIVSIGDVIVSIALFVLIQKYMCPGTSRQVANSE